MVRQSRRTYGGDQIVSHQVEKMAYTGEVPWHGLGFKVEGDLTPAQMLKAAHLDWGVSKRPLFIGEWQQVGDKQVPVHNGKPPLLRGTYALVRDSDETQLSVVGSGYNPVQNKDALDFFRKFVEAGHMTMETAGSLYGGKYVWALAKIGKHFNLSSGDRVEGYLLLCSPHVHGRSLLALFTPIRVVCNNTLTAAIGGSWSKKSQPKGHFRMPHSMKFDDDTKAVAELTLGIAKEQMDEFEAISAKLTKKKMKVADIHEYFCDVMQVDAGDAETADAMTKGKRIIAQLTEAYEQAPGQQLVTAKGTLWGVFNAVTYVADHMQGRTRDIGLKNAWFSQWAAKKRRAFKLALERVV